MTLTVEIPTRRRQVVLALACLTSFLLYLHRYTWNLVRPELQREYNLDNEPLEQLGAVFYVTYGFGQIPGGIVADVFGPHLFLSISILLWSASLPILALSGSLLGLGSARLLLGGAQAGVYPALSQVTRAWFPIRSRTIVQGWVATFFGRSGGAVSSMLMGTVLMGWCGLTWRWSLAAMAAPGVLFALVFYAVFRNRPEDDPRVNDAECRLIEDGDELARSFRRPLNLWAAIKHRPLATLLLIQLLAAGADVPYTLLMGSFLKSRGVTDPQMLGVLVSLPLWGGALGGVAGGFLNDWLIRRSGSRRWGRSTVGCAGCLLAATTLLISVQMSTASAVAAGLFFVKFFVDWTQPTIWGSSTDIGRASSATVFSIVNTAGTIGAIGVPLVIGPLLDHFTVIQVVNGVTQKATSFTPMFVIIGGMYALGGLCWLAMDCTQPLQDRADHSEAGATS